MHVKTSEGSEIGVLFTNFVLGATAHAGLNTGDILFQLAAFIVLMLLLTKFAFGPLMGIMKERESHVASEIESAEKSRAEAAALLEEQRTMLKEARQESLALIEEAKKHGETQREEIIAMARQEAERVKESATREIEQQKEQAVAALREQVASLSVLIASKVIEKELSAKDQEKLINEYIQEAGEER